MGVGLDELMISESGPRCRIYAFPVTVFTIDLFAHYKSIRNSQRKIDNEAHRLITRNGRFQTCAHYFPKRGNAAFTLANNVN